MLPPGLVGIRASDLEFAGSLYPSRRGIPPGSSPGPGPSSPGGADWYMAASRVNHMLKNISVSNKISH